MLKQKLARFFAVATATMFAASSAMAKTTGTGSGTATTTKSFDNFAATVNDWASGPLGVGLSITMMLVGTGMGIARNSPMPALSGVAGAAFLNWGPGIITELVTSGALI